MKALFIALSVLVLLPLESISQTHTFTNDEFKCEYKTTNGRFNGAYASHYNNGQKKAEGHFENNLRTGTWKVYDSTGQIKVKRVYTAPFDYVQTIFQTDATETKEVTSSYKSVLNYNADGYIDYFELEAKMVVWAKRIWRYIEPDYNTVLFENNNLFKLLLRNLSEGHIQAYSSYSFSETDTRKFDAADYSTIGYKIVEDNVFDNARALHETRIIGLCPIVVSVHTKDTLDLCWFYFPALRKVLAKEALNISGLSHIKTLDDLFFYRYFFGQIYKEGNVSGRPISAYITNESESKRESQRIELSIIEMVNDVWWHILPE